MWQRVSTHNSQRVKPSQLLPYTPQLNREREKERKRVSLHYHQLLDSCLCLNNHCNYLLGQYSYLHSSLLQLVWVRQIECVGEKLNMKTRDVFPYFACVMTFFVISEARSYRSKEKNTEQSLKSKPWIMQYLLPLEMLCPWFFLTDSITKQ